jgi:hypothetical protein
MMCVLSKIPDWEIVITKHTFFRPNEILFICHIVKVALSNKTGNSF